MDFEQHPLRARILAELHARPLEPVGVPARILHCAFMADAERARDAVSRFCASLGEPVPPPGAKHHRLDLSGVRLRFEMHSEFVTFGWEEAGEPGTPFAEPPARLLSHMRQVAQPGPLIVAVDLALVEADPEDMAIEQIFGTTQLAVSSVEGGAALVASDFRPDPQGLVRILVGGRGLRAGQAGSLVQRLLEIETYRTLALLGLPQAQSLTPLIGRIERELPEFLADIGRHDDVGADRAALDRLIGLASALEHGAATSLFRFGATRAYHQLAETRLASLGERAAGGRATWAAFLARRIDPAMQTCRSIETRLESLSEKLSRAAQLLRTRVDVDLEAKNREQLQIMNDRLHLQLRLQQTVEGLSVAAISYYVVSLVHLALEGLSEPLHGRLDPQIGTALAIPVVVVLIAWLVRRIRRHHKVV